jgi:ABC-2 type transport system permease protein
LNLIGLLTLVYKETKRLIRIGTQVLFTPWISALLYILIFGQIIGSRIGFIAGVSYIDFVIPGLLMMNIMQSAFGHASSALYFSRFLGTINELLTSPLSYLEIVLGYLISSLFRVLIIGAGIYLIALIFTSATVEHFWLFIFYAFSVSIIFALAGLLVGIWSNHFEHLAIPQTFIIMPLTFLGGLFNSIHMLPERFQIFVRMNPFFYFVDGLRYSMIGISESNRFIGSILIFSLIFILCIGVLHLFKDGYKIKT